MIFLKQSIISTLFIFFIWDYKWAIFLQRNVKKSLIRKILEKSRQTNVDWYIYRAMVIVCPSPKSPANTATPPLVMCVNGNCDAVRLYCYPSSSTQVHVRRASVAGAELLICSTTLSLSGYTHSLSCHSHPSLQQLSLFSRVAPHCEDHLFLALRHSSTDNNNNKTLRI